MKAFHGDTIAVSSMGLRPLTRAQWIGVGVVGEKS